MTPFIMNQCVVCGTCWDICPKHAVEEHEDYYKITSECDDCGKCIKACPNYAIAKSEVIGLRLEQHVRDAADDGES